MFVLAETENGMLAQLKAQLHCSPPFADRLFAFFSSLFRKWPGNISFSTLFGKCFELANFVNLLVLKVYQIEFF